jgi:AraC family ethanolamine operon transcriptional activator
MTALSAPFDVALAACPAVSVQHVDTRDVDEQAALLTDWHQDYAQLSAGGFEGRIDEAWLDGVHLFVEATSQRLHQRGELRADRLALGLPLALPEVAQAGPARFCGRSDWQAAGGGEAQDGAGHFCTFSGRGGFEFFTPAGLVMAGMEFDRTELARLATPEEQALLERIGQVATLHRAPEGALATLRDFMRGAFEMLAAQPRLLGNPAMRSMLRQAAQSNALELLVGAAALPPEAGPRPVELVAQARAIVDRDPETPLTVATLCAELAVSRRTLQAAFQQALGLAPAAYLRATRLAGARRALRQAPSVTEAAAQWGFWHFGHFAQDYRRMYGELPSQTWRRLHPGGTAAH